MKLVKFENGKYGVRLYWFFGWRFLSVPYSGGYIWSGVRYINSYCQGTKEEAENALKKYQCKYNIVNNSPLIGE